MNVTPDDFPTCEEEVEWIIARASARQPVNPRVFRKKFPDFPWVPTEEPLKDLLSELKQERALADLNTLFESVLDDLDAENAIEKAMFLREQLGEITRSHSYTADSLLVGDWRKHLAAQKQKRALRAQGTTPGIQTGLKHIDVHWDGLVRGRFIVALGRPGEGKSYLFSWFEWQAIKQKLRVLKFSPEMSAEEHNMRLHTLASADKDVQREVGLEHSFRNRALMAGIGYNIKTYARFLEWMEGNCGEILVLSGKHRRAPMTPAYVESKIQDFAPDLVVIDPIYKMKTSGARYDSPVTELARLSDELQDLCEMFDVPMVVSNQAHRQGSERDDAPHKDKSFQSDVPIQEADHVIGVKNLASERRMILRCTKSRFGDDFRFECAFHPNTGVLRELEEPNANYYNGADDPDEDELKQIIDNATRGYVEGSESAADMEKKLDRKLGTGKKKGRKQALKTKTRKEKIG